jgi:hypothetical protein
MLSITICIYYLRKKYNINLNLIILAFISVFGNFRDNKYYNETSSLERLIIKCDTFSCRVTSVADSVYETHFIIGILWDNSGR